jgi:molybdate transport system ATP-binding protein
VEIKKSDDRLTKDDILPYLERLRDEARVPIIYVSHNAAEVKRIASHVVRIDGGRVTATGTAELLDAGQVDMLA